MTRGQVSRRKDTRVRSVRRLTAGFLHHGAPVWSPDGRLLGFTLGRGADSHWLLTDRKGRAARVLEGPVVGGASVAADYRVAYGRQVGATAEIWLLPAIAAQPQRLLGGDGRLYRDPAFSPDGRWLCYAADDGPDTEDSPLRLWIDELARQEPTLLVAAPPAIEGAAGPVRAAQPAWSADGAWVFFTVFQGERSAVAIVEVATRKAQLLTGPGFCRPAPIAPGMLCVERAEPDQLGEVCLLQYRLPRPPTERPDATPAPDAAGVKVRTIAIAGIPDGAREPAVVVSKKGAVRIAWIAPGGTKGGEPQRYDVHLGQLARLPLARVPRAADADGRTAEDPAADASIVRAYAAAAAAGLSSTSEAKPETGSDARTKDEKRAKAKKQAKVERAARAAETGAARGGKSARPGRGGDGLDGDEAPADAERGV